MASKFSLSSVQVQLKFSSSSAQVQLKFSTHSYSQVEVQHSQLFSGGRNGSQHSQLFSGGRNGSALTAILRW